MVDADRGVDVEGGHASVLADGTFIFRRHIDVGKDDIQCLRGLSVGLLIATGGGHGGPDVGGKVGGGLSDEFDEAGFEKLHGETTIVSP